MISHKSQVSIVCFCHFLPMFCLSILLPCWTHLINHVDWNCHDYCEHCRFPCLKKYKLYFFFNHKLIAAEKWLTLIVCLWWGWSWIVVSIEYQYIFPDMSLRCSGDCYLRSATGFSLLSCLKNVQSIGVETHLIPIYISLNFAPVSKWRKSS